MAKVTDEYVETTLSEQLVKTLYAGLKIASDHPVTNFDVEQVLNWAEGLQHQVVVAAQTGTELTEETNKQVENVSKLASGELVAKITDDGALIFVESMPYIQKALEENAENCLVCTEKDCPLSLPNRTAKTFGPN